MEGPVVPSTENVQLYPYICSTGAPITPCLGHVKLASRTQDHPFQRQNARQGKQSCKKLLWAVDGFIVLLLVGVRMILHGFLMVFRCLLRLSSILRL